MTRKDYRLIAEALRRSPYRKDSFFQWEATVGSIADAMAKDNPRFDRRKFLEACEQNPVFTG
jgi:hypothetical protein